MQSAFTITLPLVGEVYLERFRSNTPMLSLGIVDDATVLCVGRFRAIYVSGMKHKDRNNGDQDIDEGSGSTVRSH